MTDIPKAIASGRGRDGTTGVISCSHWGAKSQKPKELVLYIFQSIRGYQNSRWTVCRQSGLMHGKFAFPFGQCFGKVCLQEAEGKWKF